MTRTYVQRLVAPNEFYHRVRSERLAGPVADPFTVLETYCGRFMTPDTVRSTPSAPRVGQHCAWCWDEIVAEVEAIEAQHAALTRAADSVRQLANHLTDECIIPKAPGWTILSDRAVMEALAAHLEANALEREASAVVAP